MSISGKYDKVAHFFNAALNRAKAATCSKHYLCTFIIFMQLNGSKEQAILGHLLVAQAACISI